MIRRLVLLLLVVALGLPQTMPTAQAAGAWSFEKLATVGLNGIEDVDQVKVNDGGRVVFEGTVKDAVTNTSVDGIYFLTPSIAKVVVDGDSLPNGAGAARFINLYAIDNQGRVLFSAAGSSTTSLNYRWINGTITAVPDTNGIANNFSHINEDGSWTAYRLPAGGTGDAEIYLTDGVTRELVTTVPLVAATPANSCRGQKLKDSVVSPTKKFAYVLEMIAYATDPITGFCTNFPGNFAANGTENIFINGTAITGVSYSKSSSLITGQSIWQLDINNAGTVLYQVQDLGTSKYILKLLIGSSEETLGTNTTMILIDLNELNQPVYLSTTGSFSSGNATLFAGVNDPVISTGDLLFAQTVNQFYYVGVNSPPATGADTREIIFVYEKGGGTGTEKGIARATKGVIRWATAVNGDWSDQNKWSPIKVPSVSENALFDVAGSYSVNVGSHNASGVQVTQGEVFFNNNALNLSEALRVGHEGALLLTGGTVTAGDVELGTEPPFNPNVDEYATLNIVNQGTKLNVTRSIRIGLAEHGLMRMRDTQVTANETRLGIGASGEAIVSGQTAAWNTGALAVGDGTDGALLIQNGAHVVSGPSVIGHLATNNPQASSTVAVQGQADGNQATWTTNGDLIVGDNHQMANLSLFTGGQVMVNGDFYAAKELSDATLLLRGAGSTDFPSKVTVSGKSSVGLGAGGAVTWNQEDGGTFSAADDLLLALHRTSVVALTLDGVHASGVRTTFDVTNTNSNPGATCQIGFAGMVFATISNGAMLRCDLVAVGGLTGSSATILVTGFGSVLTAKNLMCIGASTFCGGATINTPAATVRLADRGLVSAARGMIVGKGGKIEGTGNVIAGPLGFGVFDGGVVDPGINVTELFIEQGRAALQAMELQGFSQAGVLTVQSSMEVQPTGVVKLDVRSATEADKLVVEGALTMNGTLQLNFTNGYAPKVGDVFTLIQASSMTGTPTVQIGGLAPGFEYTLNTTNGVSTVTALNNGVSLTQKETTRLYLPIVKR